MRGSQSFASCLSSLVTVHSEFEFTYGKRAREREIIQCLTVLLSAVCLLSALPQCTHAYRQTGDLRIPMECLWNEEALSQSFSQTISQLTDLVNHSVSLSQPVILSQTISQSVNGTEGWGG